MYLVTTDQQVDGGALTACDGPAVRGTSLADLLLSGWRWWKTRRLEQQRRTAKKQLFLLETIVLGPKQRVVLMRCGAERFLVGLGSEGVTSVVRLDEGSATEELPLVAGADGHWG